ncbi:uncharacterized protein cubi_00654 [Cryptosporidium ubiquitum]|uniref:Uncharacterized protein n=1 Tax=Cryptosporidium ubiquitum TaxID=857276 RepID=A0A1J4MCA6_9CRYT|nr:uncharacterized protein cubi_00654 [Cryptosporidium ubiquitum]OII71846.1 hypothetical protein cubi_00654 [Cryptosporidium ubiquitum]
MQTIRLSLLGLCKDTLFDKTMHKHDLNNLSNNLNIQENRVSLLEFFREIVNSSYKGDIRFLFNDSSKKLSERELYDSLPFLTARYLPLIIDYFGNNKSELEIEGTKLSTLNKLCNLARSINDKMASKLMENPMSGMNSEFCASEDWNSFFRLFFNEKIILKINPSREWKAHEFFKLPNQFKSRASKIAAKKRFLRLLKINILSNKYINSICPCALPWSSNIIDETIRRYNFKCSLVGILNNTLSNLGKIVSKNYHSKIFDFLISNI